MIMWTKRDFFAYRDDNVIVLTPSAGCNVSISCDVEYHDGQVWFRWNTFRRAKSTFRPEVGFGGVGHRSGLVVAAAAEKTACPLCTRKWHFEIDSGGRALPSPALVREPRGEALLNDTRSATNAANSRIAMRRCIIKINYDYRGRWVDGGG